MAEIRDEKEKGGQGCDDALCGCKGDSKPVRRNANNSIRGAALSLCMSVDELLDLLEKRDARLSWSSTDPAKLERIAELESRVKALEAENAKLKESNKALSEIIVVTL